MKGSRGFTLIEVAIALAIVGVGVTTVLELFSGGLRMEGAAAVRARAVIYARGLLDETLARPEMLPAADQGQFDDGFRFERRIREAPEYTDQSGDLDIQSDVTMFEVEVTVLWPQSASREGTYTLRTLRVAPRPAG